MASFPTTVKSFASRSNGQVIDAAHVGDLQDEVNAIEDGYLNGTARLNSSHSTVVALSVSGGSTLAGALTVGGPVTLSSGVTVSGGITFPATPSATASTTTITDYRRSEVTPVLGGTGGQSGQSYAVQSGSYVRLDRKYDVWMHVQLSGKGTITGNVQMAGLPAPSAITATCSVYYTGLNTNWVQLQGTVVAGSTAVAIRGSSVAGVTAGTALVTGDIANGTELALHLSYIGSS